MINNNTEQKFNKEENLENKIIISKLYDMIAHNFILNQENLIAYGFTELDIKKLIDEKILITNDKNEYNVLDIRDLTGYGIKQLLAERYIFAKNCISKCYSLTENKREYLTRLILTLVNFKKYQEAIEVYTHLEILESDNKKSEDYYYNTNIMYLYLLNMLTTCNQRHQNIINDLDQDLMLKEIKKLNLSDVDNEIRKCIILNKFKFAFQLVHNKIKTSCDYTIEDQLLRQLLCNTVDLEEKYKKDLFQYLKTEEYQKILDLLDEKRNHRYLNNQEMYAYLVTECIIKIRKTGIIPISKISNTAYLYDAIKGNNFSLAQEINRSFLKRKNKLIEKDLLDMLLTKINEIILEIKLDISKKDDEIKILEEKKSLDATQEEKITLKEEQENLTEISNYIEETTKESSKEIIFAEELAYYIKAEMMTIDEARKKLGIKDSQILLIKLIYARDYFIEGMDELGNKLLKEVENNKEKPSEVFELLNEIKRNKILYKNKTDSKIRKKEISKNI